MLVTSPAQAGVPTAKASLNPLLSTPAAALAFQQQVVDSVPMEEFDRRIDYLVTSGGIFDCRNAGG